MDEDLASVRVDIDSLSPSATTHGPDVAPNPERPGGGRSWVVGVVAILAIGIFSLQPERGETALGDQRQSTTTTTPPEEAEPAQPPEEPEPETTSTIPIVVDEPISGVEEIDIGSPIAPSALSIVFAGPGETQSPAIDDAFWMLRGSGSAEDSILYRSFDGVEWAPFATNLADTHGEHDERQLFYRGLTLTETGMALIREAFEGRRGSTSIERLVSTDGATWSVDETYLAAAAPFGGSFSTLHTKEVLAYASGEVPPRPIEQLFRAVLRPEVELPAGGICFASSLADSFTVFGCDAPRGRIELSAEEFSNPDELDEIRACFHVLDSDAFKDQPSQRSIHRFIEGTSMTVVSDALPLGDAVGSDGTIVAIALGSQRNEQCDPFLAGNVTIEPALEFWKPDGSVESIPLPDAITASFPFPPEARPIPAIDTDDSVYVTIGRDVWHYEPESTTWTERATLRGAGAFDFQRPLIADGRAALIAVGSLALGDLQTGETTTVDYARLPLSFRNDELIYLDEHVAFVTSFDGPLQRVELPQPPMPGR